MKETRRYWHPKRGQGEGIAFLRSHLDYHGDDCVLWPLAINKANGYGHIGFEGKLYRVHRFMCELAHGPSPSPAHHAAHSCHQRHCINPRHLSWKTSSGNMLDKRDNGTASKTNVKGWLGKLTVEQVNEIRALGGIETQIAIGKRFGITESNVRAILAGRTWRDGKPKPVTRVLAALAAASKPIGTQEIAAAAGISERAAQSHVHRLVKSGQIKRESIGRYVHS